MRGVEEGVEGRVQGAIQGGRASSGQSPRQDLPPSHVPHPKSKTAKQQNKGRKCVVQGMGSPSASVARPPSSSAAFPLGQALSAAAHSLTNCTTAGEASPRAAVLAALPAVPSALPTTTPLALLLPPLLLKPAMLLPAALPLALAPAAPAAFLSQEISWGTMRVATREPPAELACATSAHAHAMLAARSSPACGSREGVRR